jgi:hypothetical protein
MTKGVAEQVETATPRSVALGVEAFRLINDLEEVEAILREIGASLESKFEVPSGG